MNLVNFYQTLLAPPAPWHVSKVEMCLTEKRVDVWLEHEQAFRFICPICRKPQPTYDHTEERIWRHLDTCDFPTYLHARLPRISCPEHGVRTGDFGMAESDSRMTCKMESFCIKLLQACSTEDASRLIGASWDVLHGVQARAVKRGLARRGDTMPTVIGIDEKQVFSRHRYFTIITDITHRGVWDVLDKRATKDIAPWFEQHKNALAEVEEAAMDMSAGGRWSS